ncbi:ISAs1 family transposase [Xylophilus sp. GW821-FHT01B05]
MPDPRTPRTRRHELQSILAIALCATLAGADNWVEVAEFGELHQDWFARFVPMPSGIASHDTFARVFRLLDAQELEQACQRWLQQLAGQVQGSVAIDGKSVRGSRKGDAPKALHMVSAWAADMGLLLGQRKVDGKSNEITAIPELLRLLHLKGCIVTIDAIGCQKSIAGQLHAHGADYVLSLKANQPHMHGVVQKHFAAVSDAQEGNTYAESCVGHGRREQRSYRVSPIPAALQRAAAHWPGLSSVVQVVRQRQRADKPMSEEVSYYPQACRRTRLYMCWRTASVRTGVWRTSCTGAWMWACARMLRSPIRTRARITRPCCGAWPCRCSRAIHR